MALPYNGLASPLGLPRQGSHSSPDSEPQAEHSNSSLDLEQQDGVGCHPGLGQATLGPRQAIPWANQPNLKLADPLAKTIVVGHLD